jgi:hypothetical protein
LSKIHRMFGCSALIGRPDCRRVLHRAAYFIPLVWVAAVVSGLGALQAYKSQPGSAGHTPAVLTEPSGSESPGRPRLLMFLHPKCPCSKASLSELAEIVAREPDKARVEVVFVKPEGAGSDWAKTSLREQAAAIPDVRLIDDDGTLAHRLGAETSGYVVLYDARGKLLFSGGITRSRGHEGDNSGRRSICALLHGDADAAVGVNTPVYGCPLFSPGQCADPSRSAAPTGKLP